MDFTLSKQHEMARTLFKEFAEKEVKPLAQEVDETEVFPRGTVEKMAKAGFLGIPVPKEYGGQGCDPLTYAMCVEELSKVCGTTGVIVSAHTSLCCDPIQTYGTEEQKQKYLVPLANLLQGVCFYSPSNFKFHCLRQLSIISRTALVCHNGFISLCFLFSSRQRSTSRTSYSQPLQS